MSKSNAQETKLSRAEVSFYRKMQGKTETKVKAAARAHKPNEVAQLLNTYGMWLESEPDALLVPVK